MAKDRRFFAVFIAVDDYTALKSVLMDFKQKVKDQGEMTVFDCEQSNYDFLYNSLSERANAEKKGRGEP
jgi:hypothetical protein